jgi:hypothetical protein
MRCISERGVPMVLSERERRLLQEMESHLLTEDPRLASSLKNRRLRPGVSAVLTVAGLVVGVLVMIIGIGRAQVLGTVVALVGFTIVLISSFVAGEWVRARGVPGSLARGGAGRARRAS